MSIIAYYAIFWGGVDGGERGGEIFLSEGPPTFLLFETTDSNIW